MANDDDPERRAFLARLEEPLRARFPGGEFVYAPVRPFPCLALRVELGAGGAVEVVPVSVSGNAMGYSGTPFPGDGVAHWQVRRLGAKGEQRGRLFTCKLEQVEAALEAWTAPPLPVPELVGPPKARAELAALASAKRPAFTDVSPGAAFAAAALATVKLDEANAELQADLAALAPERIAYFFPIDAKGARAKRVILNSYGAGGGRQLCLFVASKRNTLELGLEQLIEGNHAHVWSTTRWRWDRRAPVPPPEERWGLAAGDERPALMLELMDEGRYGEALAIYGVTFDERLARRVGAQRLPGSLSPHADDWAEELREVLWSLAPWRFAARLGPGRAGRIHLLGHQTGLHKEWLEVWHQTDGEFRLSLESTTQNSRLPEHAFRRELEQDLARFGLAVPEVPPPAPATAAAAAPAKARPPSGKAEARARALQAKWEEQLLALLHQPGHVDYIVTHARRRASHVVLPIILQELGSSAAAVRARVLAAAGRLLLPVGEQALACLADANTAVVGEAMEALCRLRYAPALAAIATCVYERPALRSSGAGTLRSWGARPTDALSAHLASDDERLRAAAAIAIGVYRSRTHPKALLERLASDTPLVAGAALRALELLDVPDAKIAERLAPRADAAEVRTARDHWAEVKPLASQ